jgi:hypothetical protein
MHGNRRYVKLAWIALVCVLALPATARSEIVAPTVSEALLAVAKDGTPRVAFFSARDVVVARRGAAGWSFARAGRAPSARAGRAPSAKPVLAGLVVDTAGRASVLVEAENGSWLALASRGRPLRVVFRPPRRSSVGPAGLVLDAAGRPAFAYTLQRPSGKTWLRLVTTDARGQLHTHGITKGGFPQSPIVPAAAPVLVRGRLHVVQTFTNQAIDWHPKRGGGWEGQYLFASLVGSPAGRVGAAVSGSTLWAAWTEMTTESLSVLLTFSAATQDTVTAVEHGIFASLFVAGGRPELGAYDWVEPVSGAFVYAGLLAAADGPFAELDGRLEGYAAAPDGGRQLVLSTGSGLEWFQTPARPAVRVSFGVDASGHAAGRVTGAGAGVVQIYLERGNAPRELAATAELGTDGSFTAQVTPPASPTFYRAVYVDQSTGVPYGELLREPVG